MYRDMVDGARPRLLRTAARAPTAMVGQRAGDLIDDTRHLNQRIDQVGRPRGDFVQAVNFPQFVKTS